MVKYLQKEGYYMDIHNKLRQVLDQKGWTRYRLCKECGLSESSLTNIFKRGNIPTIGTLEIICNSMGITLSQFFAENEMIEFSPEIKQFYDEWTFLTKEQKEAVLQIMRLMKK